MRTALVTGATAGIGEATVRTLIGSGWRCVATGRRKERLDALVNELGPDKVHAACFDVTDETGRDAALDALPDAFAGIDLLVNNAGLALGTSAAQDSDLADWKTMIETNVTALVSLTHKLLPVLIERKGAIVNLSSVAANYPYAGGNVYGGTKAFVRQFSLNLRADLIGTNVRVTSVEPGMAETEFSVVRFSGDAERAAGVYAGVQAMSADDVALVCESVLKLPAHINVNTLEIMPVQQAFGPFAVDRG
jgi:serine 3-dehydrogenase (NADP+)